MFFWWRRRKGKKRVEKASLIARGRRNCVVPICRDDCLLHGMKDFFKFLNFRCFEKRFFRECATRINFLSTEILRLLVFPEAIATVSRKEKEEESV